jgi:hypothetical protein
MTRARPMKAGLLVTVVALALSACGAVKPFDYQPTADEMKPGSGLFSGDDGAFEVYDD